MMMMIMNTSKGMGTVTGGAMETCALHHRLSKAVVTMCRIAILLDVSKIQIRTSGAYALPWLDLKHLAAPRRCRL